MHSKNFTKLNHWNWCFKYLNIYVNKNYFIGVVGQAYCLCIHHPRTSPHWHGLSFHIMCANKNQPKLVRRLWTRSGNPGPWNGQPSWSCPWSNADTISCPKSCWNSITESDLVSTISSRIFSDSFWGSQLFTSNTSFVQCSVCCMC